METKGLPILDKKGELLGYRGADTDITESYLVNKQLEESEEKYKTLFESNPDYTILVDLDGVILDFNVAAEQIIGKSREELIGKHFLDLGIFPKEELDLQSEKFSHTLKHGNLDPYRARIIDKNGEIRWVLTQITTIKKDDTVTHFLVIGKDITEYKISEEALKESEMKYRAIMDYSSDAIFLADFEGKFVECNKKAENLLGYSKEEILKLNFIDIHPPEELEKVQKFFKKYLEGFSDVVDTSVLTKDNKKIPVAIKGSVIEYGNKKVAQAIFRDMTIRIKAEKELRESEDKYKTLFESDPNYTILVGIDGVLQDVNKKAEQIIGLTKDKLIGKKFSELEIFPKEEIDLLKEKFSQTLKYGNVAPYISRVIDKNGEIRWVLNECTAIKKDDAVSYVLVIGRDITFQKKAEDKLRESAERFRAVAESAVDAIVTTDANGKIIFFNDSLTKIFGYTKEEIKGKPLTILMPERFRKHYLEDLQKFKESGEHRMIGKTASTTGLRKDGIEFPFEMSLATWKSGKKTYFTSIIRDITRQKIAEEQTKDHLKKLTILNQVIEMANKASNIDDLLKNIVDFTVDLLGCDSGSIYLLEENKRFAELVYHENYPKAFLEDYRRVNLDELPFSSLYTDKKPLYLDIKNEPGIARHGFKSVALVPLYSAGRVIGSIHMSSSEKSSFSNIEKDILESIGMETGTVIAKMYSEAAIKDSLREKELLLKEIHHRVKNNMQIISSLLNLQSHYIKDKEMLDVLKESQNRIKSMAMIHEKLYQSDNLTDIEFDDYIQRLVSDLFYSYSIQKDQIKPLIEVEDVKLNIETAIPCGLIISELVSNSLKHAFPSGRKGELHVSLQTHDDEYELKISDNGIGIPESIDYTKTNSLGLQLVNNLVKQVDGEIELNRHHGTEFKITFKELKYKERVKSI